MLKHLPRSGMDFLLHIFNLSWSSHSFPSIWKTSSIIPIHKMAKPFDSPASFRPISLTSCVSKLFERIILSRLLFFLESNSVLSPRQAGFRPGQSTLDQILYLSQSISDGFNKPRPGSRTILSTIDFSKAFDSVWHPALFHKLISAGLPPCFARWTQSFLFDRRASVVYQNHKSRSFRVRRGVPQGSVQVCSSFFAEACVILHALCWSRQHYRVCHFSSLLLLSHSRSFLATQSSPPSFLLSLALWQIWQELSSLSSCSIRLQWVPGHSFLLGNDAADELARRGALLAPSAISCSLSLLTSRIHSRLILDWRRTVSSKFFGTQFPSISTEELVLPRHACCVISRLCYNGHSLLLGSYLSRIGRIENPSCSACGHSSQDTSHLILHCPATDYLRCSLFRNSLSL